MSDIRYWIGFNRIPNIGPVRLGRLLETFGNLETAWGASPAALRAAHLPKDALESLLYWRGRMDLDTELTKVRDLGLKVVTWDSDDYPPLLRHIDDSPPLLYIKGELLPTDEWAVAVVGTRSATTYGKEITRRLASGLAQNGVTVVSGLALGIDGVAHRAALEAGGRTLAVFGCSLDTVYPVRHRDLAKQICQAGALVSDYPLGTNPDGRNFPPRNRLISGLSLGTVVVEAGAKSGSLITLHYALEQGRETFAVPGNIYARSCAGTNGAIQRGEAKLVTSVKDILEELNLTMVVEQTQMREIVPETATEETLLSCLSMQPVHIDDIVQQSELTTSIVSSTLCMMELKGMVRRVDNMSYVLAH
ncbi:MAG: DNA-processing protein DprA [Chloroflexota bacterium]|nr:DNA-processing protein DprA [Chloroflexota bacterium]